MGPSARVCPHCGSHQGWFSSTRDPRFFLVSVLGWSTAVCLVVFFIKYFMDEDKKKISAPAEPSCRGLVTVSSSKHTVETKDNVDRLFAQVLLENRFKGDVSDPVIRVDVFGKSGELIDTFVRSVYGANLPAASSAWFRVADILAIDPTTIDSVKASVQKVDCHGSWR